MTKKKAFLVVQSLLCALVAGLLAAGALTLYFDGAAAQAEGGLFDYIYTREKAAAKLLPVLPAFLCAFGLSLAGLILGVRDENADKPVRDETVLRYIGSVREKSVRRQADRKTQILRAAVLAAALILIVIGILNGGLYDVLSKGALICTECIGLG